MISTWTHPSLHGWTVQRIAVEARVHFTSIYSFIDGRLMAPWSRRRIQQTLNWLGFANTQRGR